jgi:hypothetical protein
MIDKQTERTDSREVETRSTELNATNINTASADHDLFVVLGVEDVKRRINTLEKSDIVSGVPRLGVAQAMALTTWKIELPKAVSARQ